MPTEPNSITPDQNEDASAAVVRNRAADASRPRAQQPSWLQGCRLPADTAGPVAMPFNRSVLILDYSSTAATDPDAAARALFVRECTDEVQADP